MKKGQKRAYVVTKLAVSPKVMDIESKACLFYRMAVVKDRKYRFRTYRSVFVGKEMVDSMVVSGLAKNRDEAVQLGRFLAKKLNLFQNIENCVMNKTILFEDNASKYYRFSGGALRVIRNMEEDEKKDDQEAASTKQKGSPMQKQDAPRNIVEKSESTKNDNEVMDVSVFKKKTKNTPKALKKETTTNNLSSLPVMRSIVEEENEDEQTPNSPRSKELERLEEIQKLARIQAAFEIRAGKLPEEEKGRAEKDRIQRLRLLAKEQLEFHRSSRKCICSVNVINEYGNEDDDVVIVNTKERMLASIVNRLEANHPKDLVATYASLMNEIDKKVSSIYTGDHKIVETQWGDIMGNTSNKEEEKEEEAMEVVENSHSEKEEVEARKDAKENPTEEKSILNNEPSNAEESYNDDEETYTFVMSPKDLPTGFRRNDLKESFITFESLLTRNNYPSLQDDDQSAWTEYIIGDDEGREQYRLNEIKRGRSSYTSYVEESVYDDDEQSYMEYIVADDETRYDDESVFDEKTVVSQSEESFQSLMKATNGGDDQSMMDFSIFDNDYDTVQVSYVVDDINYVAPEGKEEAFQEPAHIPSSPSAVKSLGPKQAAFTSLQDQMESNFPVVYANCSSMADDEVTVITMDYSLMD